MNTANLKRDGMLFCLVGPSAGGKTSMGSHLLATYSDSIQRSVSMTTRAPRPNEAEAVDYFFTDEKTFLKKIDAGEFFEWAIVHGNYYGTLKETVHAAIHSGKDLLLDIDMQGIRSFKEAYPEHTVVSFIVPPTVEALIERLQSRSVISTAELKKRLQTAAIEYTELQSLIDSDRIEYFIVNDNKEHCRKLVAAVYEAERLRVKRISRLTIDSICTIEPWRNT